MALEITDSFDSKKKSRFDTNYCYGCNILLKETNKLDDFTNKIQNNA